MKAAAAFVVGVVLASGVAAGLWAWHWSDDVRRSMQLTILRTQVAGLQDNLDAAHEDVDALRADLDAASRELDATRARLAARASDPVAASRPVAAPAPSGPIAPPAPAATADAPAAWGATAAGALEREVARRFGRSLSAEQTAFLVATLATVRDASRGLDATPLDPADPASIRENVARRETLLAADAAFRDEVGMGVSAFVRGLSADKIDEAVPLPDPAR